MNYTINLNELLGGCNPTDKTIFTFSDEHGDKSTLTLDKDVADALPEYVGDVHAWIQIQYEGICAGNKGFARYIKAYNKRGKELSRRSVGDIIRFLAHDIAFSNIRHPDLVPQQNKMQNLKATFLSSR